MKNRFMPLFFGIMAVLASGVTGAQTTGQDPYGTAQLPSPEPPNFPTLFPNPTNNNGYEEWVRAADLIQNNAKVYALDNDPSPTLAAKRRVLGYPDVVQALLLLRTGANKPVYSPRTTMVENTPMSELAGFRRLARLLKFEAYVAFADGRVDAAIGCLRVGLTFGYRVQTDSLIGGLVGVVIDSIILKEFSQHLDQLSVHQCDDVRRIVEDFLAAESPAAHMLEMEKSYVLQMLEAHRSDTDSLAALFKNLGMEDQHDADNDVAVVRAQLASHPSALNALIEDARARVSARYDHALRNWRLPAAQRRPFVPDKTDSPGAALCRMLTADPDLILSKYTRERSQLRVLGVHAAIHRYRWDHNALPNGLAELHIPKLVKDAFAGSEVVYKQDGDHYTLILQEPTGP